MNCQMVEYILREKAIENSREYNLGGSIDNTERAVPVDVIKAIPAANVRINLRGEWLKCAHPNSNLLACSVCKRYWIYDGDQYEYHFCPNCGAEMRMNI